MKRKTNKKKTLEKQMKTRLDEIIKNKQKTQIVIKKNKIHLSITNIFAKKNDLGETGRFI
jgi:hypothetical protein